MTFQESLIYQRKLRGWSQEELAGRVGVSRQAVSKWEVGESVPDLPKLIALADTLEITLDCLCGRETEETPESSPSGPAPAQKRRKTLLQGVILSLCLLGAGLFGGYTWGSASVDSPAPLPDTVTAEGVNFLYDVSGLSFHFVPSVIHPDYTYQITFSGTGTNPVSYDVSCQGGICRGTIIPSGYRYELVSLTVSNGAESRAVPLARELYFRDNVASWLP